MLCSRWPEDRHLRFFCLHPDFPCVSGQPALDGLERLFLPLDTALRRTGASLLSMLCPEGLTATWAQMPYRRLRLGPASAQACTLQGWHSAESGSVLRESAGTVGTAFLTGRRSKAALDQETQGLCGGALGAGHGEEPCSPGAPKVCVLGCDGFIRKPLAGLELSSDTCPTCSPSSGRAWSGAVSCSYSPSTALGFPAESEAWWAAQKQK